VLCSRKLSCFGGTNDYKANLSLYYFYHLQHVLASYKFLVPFACCEHYCNPIKVLLSSVLTGLFESQQYFSLHQNLVSYIPQENVVLRNHLHAQVIHFQPSHSNQQSKFCHDLVLQQCEKLADEFH